ncbi:hypothetical protein [Streptomyces sp. NPDC007094]
MDGDLWVLCSLIGLGLAVGLLIAVGWAFDHRITTTNKHRKAPGRGTP